MRENGLILCSSSHTQHLLIDVLSLQTRLQVLQALLLCQQLLPLLLNLPLHSELDLLQLVLLTLELFLLQPDGLVGQLFTRNRSVGVIAVNSPRELLGTVVFVEEVVGDLLEVGKMCVEQCGSETSKVRVLGVVNLNDTPRVLAGTDRLAVDYDVFLGTDNGERHETAKLGVVGNGIFVVLLDVIGEVVDRDAVVLNVLHDSLLELLSFGESHRVGLANDGNDVDTWRKTSHELDIDLAQGVTGRCDEVEKGVDTVVAETRVTLDSRLLGQDVIVLSFQEANDLRESTLRQAKKDGGIRCQYASLSLLYLALDFVLVYSRIFVVDVVAETRGVYDGEANAHTVLLKFDMYWLDANTLFDVSSLRVVADLVANDLGLAKGVDEGGLSCA